MGTNCHIEWSDDDAGQAGFGPARVTSLLRGPLAAVLILSSPFTSLPPFISRDVFGAFSYSHLYCLIQNS